MGVGRGSGGKSPSSSPLRGNSPEPGGISRRPIVRANSSDQANLRPLLPLGQSQGQGPPTLLSPATASLSSPLQVAGLTGAGLGAALPTNTAAAIATGALPSSLGTPIETPSVISRTNSELQMGVVPDRQLEIMQQAGELAPLKGRSCSIPNLLCCQCPNRIPSLEGVAEQGDGAEALQEAGPPPLARLLALFRPRLIRYPCRPLRRRAPARPPLHSLLPLPSAACR